MPDASRNYQAQPQAGYAAIERVPSRSTVGAGGAGDTQSRRPSEHPPAARAPENSPSPSIYDRLAMSGRPESLKTKSASVNGVGTTQGPTVKQEGEEEN